MDRGARPVCADQCLVTIAGRAFACARAEWRPASAARGFSADRNMAAVSRDAEMMSNEREQVVGCRNCKEELYRLAAPDNLSFEFAEKPGGSGGHVMRSMLKCPGEMWIVVPRVAEAWDVDNLLNSARRSRANTSERALAAPGRRRQQRLLLRRPHAFSCLLHSPAQRALVRGRGRPACLSPCSRLCLRSPAPARHGLTLKSGWAARPRTHPEPKIGGRAAIARDDAAAAACLRLSGGLALLFLDACRNSHQACGSTGIWAWRTSELAVDGETRRSATDLIQHATTGACPTSAVVSIPSHLVPEHLTASSSLALDVRIIVLPAPAPHSIDCNLSQPPSRASHLRPALLHRAPRSVRSCRTSHGTSPHRLPLDSVLVAT
ncbi:hypothetical protein PSPO01_01230 [Paraphaeosphaeria sporulosa]